MEATKNVGMRDEKIIEELKFTLDIEGARKPKKAIRPANVKWRQPV